jgi:cell division septation protein DedD
MSPGEMLMTADWRRLALAAMAATAMSFACLCPADAQTAADPQAAPAKGASKAKKAAAAKKQNPDDAQEMLDTAFKLLEEGKSEKAEEILTTLLKGGKLPPALLAKGFLYRGIAYRQQKKSTQAIADLTSALWVKGGLAEAERKDALRQRSSAYQEAGLSDGGGDPVAAAMPSNARPVATRTASASGLAEDGSAASPPKQGGGWNPFAGWFGGSSSSSPSPPQESGPSGPTASIEPATPGRPASSGWSSSTEVRGGSSGSISTAAAPQSSVQPAAETRVAAVRPDGKFRVQVGMMRTEAEAQALAARLKRDHAAVLAAREPEIDQAVVGNMGSFYRVRVGPYANAGEGQAACAKLRGPGIDCMVVSQ